MVWYFVWLFPVLFWIFSSCVSSWYTLLPFILPFLCDETSCVSPVSCYLCAPSLIVTSLSAFHIVSPGFLACFVSWTLLLYLDLVFLPLPVFWICSSLLVFTLCLISSGWNLVCFLLVFLAQITTASFEQKMWNGGEENPSCWPMEIKNWRLEFENQRDLVTIGMSQCSAGTQSVPCDITVTVQTS